MATRGPPPPPPAGAVYVNGPPMDQPRVQGQQQHGFHQQQQQPQQQALRQQQAFQQLQQQQTLLQSQNGNNGARYVDLTPRPVLNEEYCRRQLTSYEVWTVRKADDPDPTVRRETEKGKRNSKQPPSPKLTWARTTSFKMEYDQNDIQKKIKELDKTSRSVTTKMADLAAFQSQQVTTLVNEKCTLELDPTFVWTLRQLKLKQVQNQKINKRQTETITLFLKRSPRSDVDCVSLYQNYERARVQQGRPPPRVQQVHQAQQAQQYDPRMQDPRMQDPRMQYEGQGQRPGPQRMQANHPDQRPQSRGPPNNRLPGGVQVIHDGGAGRGQGNRGTQDDVIRIIDDGRKGARAYPGKGLKYPGKDARNKRRGGRRDSDDSRSSSGSDSDSGSDGGSSGVYSDTETNPSSVSSGRRRRRDSGNHGKDRPRRYHEKDYVVLNNSRRYSAAAVPDPPRRAHSHVRESPRVSVEQLIATGRLPRPIAYHDDTSLSSRFIDEEARLLDELQIRQELKLRDQELRVTEHENLLLKEELRFRNELTPLDISRLPRDDLSRPLGYSPLSPQSPREDYFNSRPRQEFPTREDLRIRHAEERFRRESIPLSPRTDFRRGSLSALPLDEGRAHSYVRNPFERRA
jgi:hypothetical protein